MSLSEDEKVRIRHHCGYLNVQEAATFILGVPAGTQTQFMIELAMNKLLPAAEPLVRELLEKLKYCEDQLLEGIEAIQVTDLGGLRPNVTGEDRQQVQVRQVYDDYVGQLCNVLGIERNPFDKRTGLRRQVNVQVRG